jgi:hypothetical protein
MKGIGVLPDPRQQELALAPEMPSAGWNRKEFEVRNECVAELSPYQTEHINRFGHYALNFSRTPAAPSLDFRKPRQPETVEGVAKVLEMPKTSRSELDRPTLRSE